MNLTILLRTRNSQSELGKFEKRARFGDEIIVVDHASSDRTLERAATMGAKIVSYPREVFSYGAALNVGIPFCTNEWVLVVSPHFEPGDDGFWERLIQDLADLPVDVAACQAPIFLIKPKKRSGLTLIGPQDLDAVPWPLFGNTCCAYRRERLLAERFDERLAASEDVDWCYRAVKAGFRIAVDHRLPVLYRNRAPFSRWWKKGRSDYPALAAIYGIPSRRPITRALADLAREAILFATAQLPLWLWLRLVVKRIAELSLSFSPASQGHRLDSSPERHS